MVNSKILGLVLMGMGVANGAFAAGDAQTASPSMVRSKVFEMGSERKNLLFNMTREEKIDGNRTVLIESFVDAQGVEALHSETVLEGNRFVSYDFHQKQLGESAKIEARDGKIYFEYTDHSGKVKKDEEKWNDQFVIGTTLSRYMKAHWADLLAGKDVDMRFGVPDRRETVGFKLFKDGEVKIGDRDAVIIKMKPTSVIIAALVKPLFFYVDKAEARVLEFKGRTLPKRKDGDKWKDLDAESVYTY